MESKDAPDGKRQECGLEALLAFNSFATVVQVFKRFPLLHFVQYILVPFRKLGAFVSMEAATRKATLQRIESIGSTQHADFFDYILPPGDPVPSSDRELVHLGSLGLQMMFANWGPMADWFYGTLVYLLEPDTYDNLQGKLDSYDNITSSTVSSLP